MLGKLRNRYQTYCITYKKHTITTHHRGAGCPVDSKIDLHTDDVEGINTGLANDNESTSGSDTTVTLGGPDAEDHPDELTASNQARLTALTREINDLCQ